MRESSCRYDSDRVKAMIENKKSKYGWEFLFIGANIDAVQTAKNFGIGADRAVDYHADQKGTEVLYQTVSNTVYAMRANNSITDSWSKDIKKDFKDRK